MARFPLRTPLRLVIVGGGVAGLEAMLAVHELAGSRVKTTLIAPNDHFAYRALGIEAAFGLAADHQYSLPTIARRVGADFLNAAVDAVDAGERHVLTSAGTSLPFDAALIAVGARPVPAFDHGLVFQPGTSDVPGLLSDLSEGFVGALIIVVPPHTGWTLPAYELALTARAATTTDLTIRVVTPEHMPLGIFGAEGSRRAQQVLRDAGIGLVTGERADVLGDTVVRVGSTWLTADRVVTLPALTGPRLPGVPADDRGFITIDDCCRVMGARRLYAVGDGASYPIKQGGLASQEADVAAEHIAALAGVAIEPSSFVPVLRGMLATADGPLYLQRKLDDPGSSIATHEPLWSPPTRVASERLSEFLVGLDFGIDHRQGPVIFGLPQT
jgi:sulfide:quinone oxidoreductase